MDSSNDSGDLASRIRTEVAIADVVGEFLDLEVRGKGYIAMCPWHEDTRPGIQIDPQRNIWKCWVCDKRGDSIAFVMAYRQMGFDAAVQLLSQYLTDD
jgi:DNA primase